MKIETIDASEIQRPGAIWATMLKGMAIGDGRAITLEGTRLETVRGRIIVSARGQGMRVRTAKLADGRLGVERLS